MKSIARRIQRLLPGMLRTTHVALMRTGGFLRHFFAGDREEKPFSRETRLWIDTVCRGTKPKVSFGSTRDMTRPGAVLFANDPFPVPMPRAAKAPPVTIGPTCDFPYEVDRYFHIAAMGNAVLSSDAVRALSLGAKRAGIWLNSGENGVGQTHREGGCDLVFQISNTPVRNDALRDSNGRISDTGLREQAAGVRAFEIKLVQGAKPGSSAVLPEELPPDPGSSPSRAVNDIGGLLDLAERIRSITGRPVGIKLAVSSRRFPEALCEAILKRGGDAAPDFISVDGGNGGSGEALQSLADYVGVTLAEGLPLWLETLTAAGLRERVRVIASGGLVTPPAVAWSMAVGADFVASARGFMFALGCIQARKCTSNACPSGVAKRRNRFYRLDAGDRAAAVARYARYVHHEADTIARACGVNNARELTRGHLRLVQSSGLSAGYGDQDSSQRNAYFD